MSIFKRKKNPQPEKRNFDNVSWKWTDSINGVPVNPFHVFNFDNGLGVIVMKHSIETWDGMMCYAIDDFTADGKFRRATGLGVYDYAGGFDEFGVIDFCNRIKNVSRL